MPLASMTGFAREAGITGPFQWAWEIKTVNGRGLEVRVRTPSGFDAIGEEARGQILKALTRGQASSICRSPARRRRRRCASTATCCSRSSRRSARSIFRRVQPASIDGLLAVRGVVEVEEEAADPEQRCRPRGGPADGRRAPHRGSQGRSLREGDGARRSAATAIGHDRASRRRGRNRSGPPARSDSRAARGADCASSSPARPRSIPTASIRRPC